MEAQRTKVREREREKCRETRDRDAERQVDRETKIAEDPKKQINI